MATVGRLLRALVRLVEVPIVIREALPLLLRRGGAIDARRPDLRAWVSYHVRHVKKAVRREMKSSTAIEPIIGYLESEHRMGHNHLKGREGDRTNAVRVRATTTSAFSHAGWMRSRRSP